MSEVVRDLIVSLSLDSGEFQRNMRAINASIKEAESTFKLAGAGVDKFGSSLSGQQAKLSYLRQMQTLQTAAVQQYTVRLQEANAKMQATEGYLQKYSARLAEARAQMGPLQAQITAQSAAVQQAARAFQVADTAYQQNASAISALQATMVSLEQEIAATEMAYQHSLTTLGADATETEAYRLKLAVLNDEYDKQKTKMSELQAKGQSLAASRSKWAQVALDEIAKEEQLKQKKAELEAEIKKLEGQVKEETQALENNRTAVVKAQADLNNAKAKLKDTEAQLKSTEREVARLSSAWTQAGTALESFSKKCTTLGSGMQRTGRTMSRYLTTPIMGLATTAVTASMSYEQAFANVRRTVNATEEQFAEFSDQIEQMSTVTATSADDIAEVVATAGQLGIHTENIMDFTRAMLDLGKASTDLEANSAATELAKFANITGMSHDQFTNLSSTIIALGVNYATTESEIVEMGKRLAAAGTQVGLSEAQIMGFAAALSSVGLEAQAGGSAFSKALVKMEVAAQTGGDDLKNFAGICGVTTEQFKTMWANDPADMFQRFLVGLSKMDEEGIGAIATLQDIGLNEIRLRDTLLRATNANELFADSQRMATKAWSENTMLTTSAAEKYKTVTSQLANLKNQAMVAARQIGRDLTPTLQALMEKANGLITAFMGLDSSQRASIIKWAGIAAAMGPVILISGTLIKNVGLISGALGKAFTGIGKFSAAVSAAGGGLKGLGSVLVSSKGFWIALAAAVVVGTVALVDYVSGAKAAREALKGLEETAKSWKDTAAETFYGAREGLSFFGMSKESFVKSADEDTQSAQQWMDGMITVWSDGKKETNAIVKEWTDSWKNLTASTREGLEGLKTTADKNGYTGLSKQMEADLKLLDSMDKEIASLLKKRQNRNLTDADKVRLQELIDTREAIAVKYKLVPEKEDAAGFDTLRRKIEAEVARAEARGQDVPVSTYENAVVAAAQGLAAINSQLDEQYDSEYNLIQLMTDEAEQQRALADLNTRYNANRRQAALEYAGLLKDVVSPVWEKNSVQEAKTQVADLFQFLRQYSAGTAEEKKNLLPDLNALTSGMDEAAIAEYIGLLTQVQSLLDSGLSEEEVQSMFPDIDFSSALEQLAAIQTYLNENKWDTNLDSLNTMFGDALGEEVLKIATDLDMTGAQARWEEWASNPGSITTDAIVEGYSDAENVTVPQPTVDAFVGKYTEVAEGADKASLTPTGLLAYVQKYAEVTNGADTSGLTPKNITAMVAAYKELATGADVSTLKPSEIVAYIKQYLEKEGVDTSKLSPDTITAFVMAYEEIEGGASTAALSVTDIVGLITSYAEAEGIDLTKLKTNQLEGIVASFAEATGCDKSQLLQGLIGWITEYKEAEGVKKPKLNLTVGLTGYDLLEYRRWLKNNEVEVEGIVRLSEAYEDPAGILNEPGARYWKNGEEIPVTAVTADMLKPDDVAILDKDGTMHLLITAEITGAPEAIEEMREQVAEVDQLGVTAFGKAAGIMPTTLMGFIDAAEQRIEKFKNPGFFDFAWLSTDANRLKILGESMVTDFSPEKVAELSTYVGEVVSAIQQGQAVSQEDIDNVNKILQFIKDLDSVGVGQNVTEGIAQGMTDAGWDTSAENVATNLETAINSALVINSPSERMKPTGENVAAGIGEGMAAADMSAYAASLAGSIETAVASSVIASVFNPYGAAAAEGIGSGMAAHAFGSEAASVAARVKSALSVSLTVTTLRSIGANAMSGLAAGIRSGQNSVVTAMRNAAKAAVSAAKSALKISSPSRVFRDEIGVMTMKGLGEGVTKEALNQARVIGNAARYLTDEARGASVGYPSQTTNNRTYNSNSSISFSGSNFYIRDEQDIRSLAIEIASLTKRQQRGKGLRMA